MKKRDPVTTIMTQKIYTVKINDKLTDVIELVRKHNIRHVPVLDGKHLVGIISKSDLNRLTFSGLFEEQESSDEAILDMLTIAQVMTHKPRVVPSTYTIQDVAMILATEEFHALPVVDPNDETKLVGIVTTTDVIRCIL